MGKITKFQDALLQCRLAPKPEPVQQPEPELKPEPEPEPKPEPQSEKPESEPESNLESEVEPKSKPEPEPELETKSELDLNLDLETDYELGLTLEQAWKQEIEKQTKRQSEPNSISDLEWNSEDDMMTSSEVLRVYTTSDSENDMITKCQMSPRRLHEVFKKKYKKLRKRKSFITHERAKRMLSTAITFHLQPNNIQTSTSNLANRSLLKSQQNVNNMLPCTISSSKYNYSPLLSDNPEKKVYDQNQDYQEKIVTSYSQQMIKEEKEEKNQDGEMKQLLNDDNLLIPETDEDAPLFRHDQINVSQKLSEYISEGESMMNDSLKDKTSTSQRTKRHWRKNEENQRQNDIKRNTLSDHCYHLNEPKSVERLKMEELSESGK